MKAGEVCAGYGGLMMAIEEVFNAIPVWVSEFDPAPSKILAYRYPDVPNYGDMTKIDWSAIEPADIIGGGTPCQDLSAAGRRAGMTEGTRSNLWVHMREAIAIQRPLYVVWENVRGAYSAEASSAVEQCPGCVGDTADGRVFLRALGRVLGDLSDLGYDVQWRGLRAADVGAPHARFRVFVLARRRATADADGRRRTQSLKLAGGSSQEGASDLAYQSDRGPHAAENPDFATGSEWRFAAPGQEESGRARPDTGGRGGAPTADSPGPRRAEGQDGGTGSCYACQRPWSVEPERIGRERVGDAPADAGSATFGEQAGRALTEEARAGSRDGLGHHRGEQPPVNWGPYEPAIRRWEARLGRPAPRPTEPTGRNSGERLSPRFTEWMMGLPDGWVTDPEIGISRNEQLKACGNGVVPQQATAALRDMLAAFRSMPVQRAA